MTKDEFKKYAKNHLYQPVTYRTVNRTAVFEVGGLELSIREFCDTLLKCDWKKFQNSLHTKGGGDEYKSKFASDRLWLARRGFDKMSRVYIRDGIYLCANAVSYTHLTLPTKA